MNENSLFQNIIDQVREAQLKLSYAKETIRLYYQMSSLNFLLGTEIEDVVQMCNVLREIQQKKQMENAKENAGKIARETTGKNAIWAGLKFTAHGERIVVTVSPDACEYIHENGSDSPFLSDLITLFQSEHTCGIEEICALFEKYDSGYHCEKMETETDFDYVLFFEDKSIDSYYYCVKVEQGHSIYHRFIKQDYLDLVK